MASRLAPRGRLSVRTEATPRKRRTLAAFALGAAIATVGLAVLAANGAAARGPFAGAGYYAPQRTAFTLMPLGPDVGAPHRKHRHSRIAWKKPHESVAAQAPRDAVCVRLCDGFFFPLPASDSGAEAASCNSQCPDAPTEVYYRSNSDRIEDSVTVDGRPYSALPASLRYRAAAADRSCSCHRDAVAYAPLGDATLRRGDLIMTPAGFVMFGGAAGAKPRASDFIVLAQARLPAATRSDLQAMERVSLATGHPSLRQWLAAQSTPTLALRHIQPVASRTASGDDRIRLVVWRGAAQD